MMLSSLLGPAELYLAQAKEPFAGLRGDLVHTYPGDVTAPATRAASSSA